MTDTGQGINGRTKAVAVCEAGRTVPSLPEINYIYPPVLLPHAGRFPVGSGILRTGFPDGDRSAPSFPSIRMAALQRIRRTGQNTASYNNPSSDSYAIVDP